MQKLIGCIVATLLIGGALISWDNIDSGSAGMRNQNSSLEISETDHQRLVDHFRTLFNPEGDFKTEVVKVKVSDLRSVIDGLDPNETLDFFMAAYQEEDLARYQNKVPEVTSVTNVPTLIIGNASRYAENPVYYDFGTFCPPPYTCDAY